MSTGKYQNERLYELLPTVVRERDVAVGQQLRSFLAQALGQEIDRLQAQIAEANANAFVETCSRQTLPYIADLVGYRPISALAPTPAAPLIATADPPADAKTGHARPTFRRDVAKTMWGRRRKGTVTGLEGVVRTVAGWHTVVFENGRCVVSTPAVRYPGVLASQGTPDVRKLLGPARIDQGPGLIPRVATVERVASDPNSVTVDPRRGRWHPLDVMIEVWNRQAFLQVRRTGVHPSDRKLLTFDPTGQEIELYAPADARAQASEILESARAVRVSDFVGDTCGTTKKAIYGPDRAICLFTKPEIKLEAVDESDVLFDRTDGRPDAKLWIIDPERGFIKPPAGHRGKVACRYFRVPDERGVPKPTNGHQKEAVCRFSRPPDLYKDNDEELIISVVKIRVGEHVPMEARAGVVRRG